MNALSTTVDAWRPWNGASASLREAALDRRPTAPMRMPRHRAPDAGLDAAPRGTPAPAPRVWVLASPRAGDASQVLALAEALGWPFEVKRFALHAFELLVAPPFRASIAGVDERRSSPLAPPWPDLVLSSGRENEPIARWIKQQSDGQTRIVHVGRPWGPLDAYDLVVTTPQYRLPRRPNVLHNDAPLHRVTQARLEAEATAWADRLEHLPRPFIAVLVGGNSGPYALTRRGGERLAAAASAIAAQLGGSLLVTTSARTSPATVAALEQGLACPHYLHRWRRGGGGGNPYFAFLGLADEIIVTADSISMITEACATGKPVHLFDLGVGWASMRTPLGLPGEPPGPKGGLRTWLRDFVLQARLYRLLLRHAPARVTRDIRLVHARLVASGRATWLGEPLPPVPAPPLRDMARATARVQALLGRKVPQAQPETPAWLPAELALAEAQG